MNRFLFQSITLELLSNLNNFIKIEFSSKLVGKNSEIGDDQKLFLPGNQALRTAQLAG
jgi:hypothetical protein